MRNFRLYQSFKFGTKVTWRRVDAFLFNSKTETTTLMIVENLCIKQNIYEEDSCLWLVNHNKHEDV